MTFPELAAVRDELAERRARGESLSGVAAAVATAVIEKGIPIPPIPRPAMPFRRRGMADKLRCMAVDDSFLIEGRTTTDGLHGYWNHLAPQRYTARTVAGGVRVWRIA